MGRLSQTAAWFGPVSGCMGAAALLAATAVWGQTGKPSRPAPAAAPAATSPLGAANSNDPIDITAEGANIFQPQRLVIYKGNVEAIQGTSRLRTPELRIYYKPKTPTAPGQPAPPAGGNPSDQNSIDHIEAAGPVYYITPTENARGDYGLYEAAPNTITLSGNVVLVQGKSVGKGDKLVINRATGQSVLSSNNPAAASGRIRTILYPNQQQPNGAARPTAGGKPS